MPYLADNTPKSSGAKIEVIRPHVIVVPMPEPRIWVGKSSVEFAEIMANLLFWLGPDKLVRFAAITRSGLRSG